MLKKVLFYYNPTAGNKILSSKLDLIVKKFQEKGQYLVPVRSKKSDNLKKLIGKKEAESAGDAKRGVGGGVGTRNRVVNAMLKNGIDVPLAILPFGTANDYARSFAIPRNIEKMLDITLYTVYNVKKDLRR
jgi:diacylglycerol kinase family enzyme